MRGKLKIFGLILTILLMLAGPVFAEVTDYQVGARPIGMGGAFVGLADDANAAYWNPAGLILIDGLSLTSMHANMFGMTDLTLNYYAIGYPVNGLGFGLNLIEERGQLYEYDLGTNEYVIRRAGISLAHSFFNNLSVGATVNQYNFTTNIDRKNGMAFDLGLLYSGDKYSFGAVARNIYSNVPGDELDAMYQLGVSWNPGFLPLTLAADLSIKKDISDLNKIVVGYHLGMEYTLMEKIQLRSGYNNGNLSGGFGLNYNGFQFDYAYTMHELGPTHRISGGFNF
ncbi:hypothetical protein BBF96_14200 [Anoxybacter fermentans]|uniref:PorV/PorQ family protein n=1 Tax=Anoxybacter fermentans TaxID=1323375 RepID=A0A3S9T1E9_9FIRM|nr:hypothetical protein [Anoxybacter fermentans]AZR74436.1 hypothetical protein BBF96_14200 [Anoxybacter fermentans]